MNKRKENLKELIKGTMPFNGEADCYKNYLYAYPVVSKEPKGKILNIDFTPCKEIEGYIRGVTASDILINNAQESVKID